MQVRRLFSTAPFSAATTGKSFIKLSPKVKEALKSGKGVVALESTIISHGMPYPKNKECALEVEEMVKREGCVPATIALLDGFIHVGLSHLEIERLAKTGLDATKTSRRDLAHVLALKKVGSTTVSATMIAAHMAGIKVFVTGGIGGVHRGDGWDVSADLNELGRTPVAVVCAGVKSILDIEKTLEYLETQGVTTVTLGNSDQFPSFYTRDSGFKSMAAIPSPTQCAEMIHVNQELGLQSGMVIACPIPKEDEVQNAEQFDGVIKQALLEADNLGIKGKDTTPFLLGKIKDLTKGDSLRANIALVMNNARLGSQIAREYARLNQKRQYSTQSRKRPLIVGGCVLDISSKTDSSKMEHALYTSSPGNIRKSAGGVARNIAQVCQMAGGSPFFLSSIGIDAEGEYLVNELEQKYAMTDLMITRNNEYPTALYNSLFDSNGELLGAVADMKIQDTDLDISPVDFDRVSIVVVDGNVSRTTISKLTSVCSRKRIPILFEPTSVTKSSKILDFIQQDRLSGVSFTSPDFYELQKMASLLGNVNLDIPLPEFTSFPSSIEDIKTDVYVLLRCIPNLIVKLGKRGCLVATRRGGSRRCNVDGKPNAPTYKATLIPSTRPLDIVNVSGAGDSLVGVFVAGLVKHHDLDLSFLAHEKMVHAARGGVVAAEFTCESQGLSSRISPEIAL